MIEPQKLASTSGGTDVSPGEPAAEPDYSAKPSRTLEIAIAVVALVLSVAALVLSRDIVLRMGGGGIDPKWWPTMLSCCGIALSLVLLLQAFLSTSSHRGDLLAIERRGWTRMIVSLTLSAVYVFAWSRFGYVVPTIIFTGALLWVFGLCSWKGLVIFPVAVAIFIYGLFHLLLRVPL